MSERSTANCGESTRKERRTEKFDVNNYQQKPNRRLLLLHQATTAMLRQQHPGAPEAGARRSATEAAATVLRLVQLREIIDRFRVLPKRNNRQAADPCPVLQQQKRNGRAVDRCPVLPKRNIRRAAVVHDEPRRWSTRWTIFKGSWRNRSWKRPGCQKSPRSKRTNSRTRLKSKRTCTRKRNPV